MRHLRFPTIFTPQGDGNAGIYLNGDIEFVIPDNIYPARGRKHRSVKSVFAEVVIIPDNIYPARGRKRHIAKKMLQRKILVTIPDNIYPARGRKQIPELYVL